MKSISSPCFLLSFISPWKEKWEKNGYQLKEYSQEDFNVSLKLILIFSHMDLNGLFYFILFFYLSIQKKNGYQLKDYSQESMFCLQHLD